jgi:hypothetical protein
VNSGDLRPGDPAQFVELETVSVKPGFLQIVLVASSVINTGLLILIADILGAF